MTKRSPRSALASASELRSRHLRADGERQERRRRGACRPRRRRDHLGGLGSALSRLAHPDQSVAGDARGHLGARARGLGRGVPDPGSRCGGHGARGWEDADRHREVPASTFGRLSAPSTCRRGRRRGHAPGGSRRYDAGRRCGCTWVADSEGPGRRGRACIRTTGAASSARSSWQRPDTRLHGTRLWSTDWRHPTLVVGLDVPTAELDRRIAERTRAMFAAGVVSEVRKRPRRAVVEDGREGHGASRGGRSFLPPTPRPSWPPRTRRLAAYQRKWMRRLPGPRYRAG